MFVFHVYTFDELYKYIYIYIYTQGLHAKQPASSAQLFFVRMGIEKAEYIFHLQL